MVCFFLTFGALVKSEGQNLSRKQTERIKTQVDLAFQKMQDLAEKLDYDALSSGVYDAHEAGFVTNGKYYSRYSDLIEDVKSNARGIDRQVISVKEKNITVLSKKFVLTTVTGIARATLADGREIAADFQWSFVFEKVDGNWKVIQSHQSVSR